MRPPHATRPFRNTPSAGANAWAGPVPLQQQHQPPPPQQQQQHNPHLQPAGSGISGAWGSGAWCSGGSPGGAPAASQPVAIPQRPAAAQHAQYAQHQQSALASGLHRCASAPELPALAGFAVAAAAAAAPLATQPHAVMSHQVSDLPLRYARAAVLAPSARSGCRSWDVFGTPALPLRRGRPAPADRVGSCLRQLTPSPSFVAAPPQRHWMMM